MKSLSIYLFFGFMILASGNASATYSTDWIQAAGNYLKSGAMITRDKLDNVVVTGYIQSENIYTRKYDKFGNFMWEQTSASDIDGSYEKSRWVNCDKKKNIYVSGYRYSIGSGWEYPNAVIALKYDPDGNLLWKQVIEISYVVGSSTGLSFHLESILDDQNNLYIGTAGTSPSGFILVKLSPSGTVLANSTVTLGTIHGFSSISLKKNRVIITGRVADLSSVPVIAWDTAGNHLWTATFLGQSGNDVELDGSGNSYVLTSYPNQVSGSSGQDIVIYKLDPNGQQLFKKNYDFQGYDYPTRFTVVANKISIIGYGSYGTYLDWLIFQTNKSGKLQWSAKYNETLENDEQPYFLAAKENGEVFVTGKGGPLHSQPNGSSYLRMVTAKYSNTGNREWVDSVNIYSGWGIACTLASDSSLFVLGGTEMTAFHFLDHKGTGSCGIPTGAAASNITDTGATFTWDPVPGAYLYHVRFKTVSAEGWTTNSIDVTSLEVSTLSAGTAYEYAVEAICTSGPSGYTASGLFTTTGSGYCATGGLNSTSEYLSFVWIGAIQNVSGSNDGYTDFTNLSTDLTLGETIYGYISAALPFGLYEYYSFWIDYNQDNDFDDAGELAESLHSNFLGWISVNFTVPETAMVGTTRMRITMSYVGPPSPCGIYDRGETEDYTVVLLSPRFEVESEKNDMTIFPNPFSDKLIVQIGTTAEPSTVFIYDVTGRLQFSANLVPGPNELNLAGLHSGVYYVASSRDGKPENAVKVVKQ